MLKINIIRGEKDSQPVSKEVTFREARKAVNGDLLIYDHDLIDIVVSRTNNKLSTFPKTTVTEECYYAQKELLESLAGLGVLDRASIRAGAVHSSLEATILESVEETVSGFQITLLEVYNFLQEEEPNIQSRKMYKGKLQDFFLDPDAGDSTELGEIPHDEKKGSLDHQVRPYGYQYMYSILREMTEK
jgi:hypothetical protein